MAFWSMNRMRRKKVWKVRGNEGIDSNHELPSAQFSTRAFPKKKRLIGVINPDIKGNKRSETEMSLTSPSDLCDIHRDFTATK